MISDVVITLISLALAGVVPFERLKFGVRDFFGVNKVWKSVAKVNVSLQEGIRPKAVIVILTRNTDLDALRQTLSDFEATFNQKFNYPYVFLNDQNFTDEFRQSITEQLSNNSRRNYTFALVPKEHWSYPEWINQDRAAAVRALMAKEVIYGGSESYRHMCRYFSGFFYRHPALQEYDYYWRVEPGARFFCEVDEDPFLYMAEHGIKYGFSQTFPEIMETVPTFWQTVKSFIRDIYPTLNVPKPRLRTQQLLFTDPGHWTGCHFWNNFELGDFRFFRSEAYQLFFDYLDKAGGFFYERWGDGPVHTLAVALFLDYSEIHHFDNIGYQHDKFTFCPSRPNSCSCNVSYEFNMARFSVARCQARFLTKFQALGSNNH